LWRATLLLALVCAGCAPPAVKDAGPPPAAPETKPADSKPSAIEKTQPVAPAPVERILSPAEQELEKGIKNYEDGEYKVATKELQTALSLGLAGRGEQASAHKYLAAKSSARLSSRTRISISRRPRRVIRCGDRSFGP
jgi:hypothetical protein